MATTLSCQLCSCLSPNLSQYVSHLRLVHSEDIAFRVICGIESCIEEFTAFAAFSSHVYRRHRRALGLVGDSERIEGTNTFFDSHISDDNETGAEMAEGNVELESPEVDQYHNPEENEDSNPETMRVKAAKFLLKLREGHKVSQTALVDIISTSNEMCAMACASFKQDIKKRLEQANVDPNVVEEVSYNYPFDGMDTIYKLEKFCVENFNCVVSIYRHNVGGFGT